MYKLIDTLKLKVNRETGEILSETMRTAEQDVGWIKHCERLAEEEMKKYFYKKKVDELGNFVWLLYNINAALNIGLGSANLTRIIYLATFMNYDNYLAYDNGVKIKSSKVGELLRTGRRATQQFLSEAVGCGALTKDGTYIKLSDSIFAKGKLNDIIIDKNAMRLYADGVRRLYEAATPKEHKSLSYVFQAIPYVNLNFNILCTNPWEYNKSNISYLNLTGYCERVGYDPSNAKRLKSQLINIRVADECVFGFMETGDGNYIIMNPRIFYAGDKTDEIMVLGNFFKEKGECNNK